MSNESKIVSASAHPLAAPDITVNARDIFGIDVDMQVPAFSKGYWPLKKYPLGVLITCL